jgi:hypothetical protein
MRIVACVFSSKQPTATVGASKTRPLIGKLKTTSKFVLQPSSHVPQRERAFAGSSDEEEKEEEEEVEAAVAGDAKDGDKDLSTVTSDDTAPPAAAAAAAVQDRLQLDSETVTSNQKSDADGVQTSKKSVTAPPKLKQPQEAPKKVSNNVKAKSTLSHFPKVSILKLLCK